MDFQGRIVIRIPLIALIFSMTQCAFHLNVYYSGGQMLAALAHNFTIIGLLQVLKLLRVMQGKASDTDNLHTGMTYLFIYFDIRPTCSIQYFVY